MNLWQIVMNRKFRNQIKEWSKTHLVPYSDIHKEYYNLRLKSEAIKRGLVANYGAKFFVSKRGRVYKKIGINLWKEVPYSITIHYNGITPRYYVYVYAYNKHTRLSRLVATVWVKKVRNSDNVVMHLDDDRLNNKYTNLQWGSQSQNILMSVRKGHYSKPHRDRRLTLEQESKLLEEVKSGKFSQRELGKRWGFSQSGIQKIIKRKIYGKNTK